MKTIVFILVMISLSAFAKDKTDYTHKHKPCICDKPVIFDDTPIEKIFEFKGEIYKVLKGDETNPSILYVLDPKTDKFIRIKQK